MQADFSHLDDGATAVVVLGHGSRAGAAWERLSWVVERLDRRVPCPVVAASLQFNKPDLADSCRQLAADGVSRIMVVPYFLFEGNHLREDIPKVISELEAELKGTEILLTDSLGADERLVDVLVDRLLEVDGGARQPAGKPAPGLLEELLAAAPQAITNESFGIIDEWVSPDDPEGPEHQVLRRLIHATGDLSLAGHLLFSARAIDAGLSALSGGKAVACDVNMVASGIAPTAAELGIPVECGIAADETRALAGELGITRSAAAFRLMATAAGDGALDGAVIAIGNAPTALLECLRLAGEGLIDPALVVGVPVGFVGAAESKQALADSGLEHITLPGTRGGSSMAVAITNALLRLYEGS